MSYFSFQGKCVIQTKSIAICRRDTEETEREQWSGIGVRRRRHRRSRRHLIGRWCSHTPHTVIVTPVINFETIQFDLNENSPSAFGRLVVKSTESNKSAQRSVTLVRNHTAHFLTTFLFQNSLERTVLELGRKGGGDRSKRPVQVDRVE